MLKPCVLWNKKISAYLDGEATKRETVFVEEHLAQCPACRAFVELARCDAQDAAATLQTSTASEGFAERVMAQVQVTAIENTPAPEAEDKPSRRNTRTTLAMWGIACAGLAMMAISFLFWAQTREKYRQMACVANLKQISLANQMYAPGNEKTTGLELRGGLREVLEADKRSEITAIATSQFVEKPPTPTIAPPAKNYGLTDKLQIAYVASVGVETSGVQGAMESAEMLFRKHDGFVLTSEFKRTGKDSASATVMGRVPAEQLGKLLVALDGLGTLTARSVNGDDLTAQHLEQLAAMDDLRGEQGRLSNIGAGARRTGESLNVEDRVSTSKEQSSAKRIEEYKLKSRVRLAEVTLSIATPTATPEKPNQVAASASGSFAALLAFGKALASILVALLIWIPVWGGALAVYLYWRRKRK